MAVDTVKNCAPDDGCIKHPKHVSEPSSGIKLTAYSCICWLFHGIYYDARNHKHKIQSTSTQVFEHLVTNQTDQQNAYNLMFQFTANTAPITAHIRCCKSPLKISPQCRTLEMIIRPGDCFARLRAPMMGHRGPKHVAVL